MYGLKEILLKEQEKLQNIVKLVRPELETLPEGKLRISKCRKTVQYYEKDNNSSKKGGVYIPKKNERLASQLAQRSYDEDVINLAEKRLKQIDAILKDYDEQEIEQLYSRLSLERQNLIRPIEMTWEQKVELWTKKEYKGKPFAEGSILIYSDRGERVRSKSEKILADFFYHEGIPYKYEKPLELQGYGFIYPDFTFLSKRIGKEVYWEHEGKMDDPNYAKQAIKKIATYQANGIFPGDRLILSFETQNHMVSTNEIRALYKKYLE